MSATLTGVTVTVTAEHIARGQRESCSDCPVALALADAFPDATWIWVGGTRFEMCDGALDTCEADLPGEVEEFIHAFDDGFKVEPFTFTVNYPEVTL